MSPSQAFLMLLLLRKAFPKTLSRRGFGRCSCSSISSEWATSSTWSENETRFLILRLALDGWREEGWPENILVSSLQEEETEFLLNLAGRLLSPFSKTVGNDCFSGRELDKEGIDFKGWGGDRWWLLWGILWTAEEEEEAGRDVVVVDDVDWVTPLEVDTFDRDNLCMAVM